MRGCEVCDCDPFPPHTHALFGYSVRFEVGWVRESRTPIGSGALMHPDLFVDFGAI